VFPGNIAQYLDHKDALGLNSDNARLIRLFSTRTDRLGLVVGSYQTWRNSKTNNNMDDAQLKLSNQVCFPDLLCFSFDH
jgi:hypothetical protein